MKKVVKISVIILLFGVIALLCNFTLELKKENETIKKKLNEIETNIENSKNNENNYLEKQKQLENLKIEKQQIKEKYDEVNTWNQEIKSYLN